MRSLTVRNVRSNGSQRRDGIGFAKRLGAACAFTMALTAALPAVAQTATRLPVPPEAEEAFGKREYGKAASIIIPAFENCWTDNREGDVCATLASAVALLVATAGNEKVEENILRALAYIDQRVGPESMEALEVVSALTVYYDRVTNMQRYLPAAARRYALARKLKGPLDRATVSAAVMLCTGQWSLGRGQDGIETVSPIIGKLPERTPAEMVLAARVYECAGMAYRSMDRHREAEVAYRKALGLFERGAGEGHDLTLDMMANLANTLRRLDREGEARAMAARIDTLAKPGAAVRSKLDWWTAPSDPLESARTELAALEKKFGPQSPVAIMAAAQYGIALIDAERHAEAEPYLKRLAEYADDEKLPASVRIKLMLGQITMTIKQDNGRFDRAVPVIEKMVALTKRSGGGSDKLLINFQMYAGSTLFLGGQPARAYPLLSDAGELLLQRLATYRDFDAQAQKETREYSPIFKFKVATAWVLARGR